MKNKEQMAKKKLKQIVVVIETGEGEEMIDYYWNPVSLKDNYGIVIETIHKYDLTKGFTIRPNQVLVNERYEANTISEIEKHIGMKDCWKIDSKEEPVETTVCIYNFDHKNTDKFFETKQGALNQILKNTDRRIDFLEKQLIKTKEKKLALMNTKSVWAELEEKRGDD